MSIRPALPTAWLALLGGCALAVTAAEVLLLGLGTGFLTSGYNTPHIGPLTFALLFLPGSLVLDVALVLAGWTLVLPLVARLGARRLPLLCAAAMLGAGGPVGVAAFRYDVHARLGDLFDVSLLQQSSQLGSSALVGEMVREAPMLLLATAAPLLLCAAVLVLAGRLEEAFGWRGRLPAAPSGRALAAATGAACGVAAALLVATVWSGSPLRYGFEHKTSGIVLAGIAERISDLDGDGYGALARPADHAPLDAAVHPYAVDRPGNGIDENGLAGDHPVGFELRAEPAPGAPLPSDAHRPHFLLLYLESFRAELLGRRFEGQRVTPFLDDLAREGRATPHAYVHSPWTLESRMQLFSGRLHSRPGETTLVDDFASRGYTVAHFSGQDESYGDSVAVLGAERADVFYDARQDVERRTSRSTTPVSLQVSWKTLVRRVTEYLEGSDASRPLFLYVNIVDTHYPYWHEELDPILGAEPLDRSGIRSHRAEKVREAYLEAAANVDRAAARVARAFREHIGGAEHAILVTADHGQSFYEDGRLGHGQSLNGLQTRVPFIVWGMGGDWPVPIAPSDVRGLLRRNLHRPRGEALPRARFVPHPDRRILQYAPHAEQPRIVGMRGLEGVLQYDFHRDRLERLGPGDLPSRRDPAEADRLPDVIWPWEALQRQARRDAQP